MIISVAKKSMDHSNYFEILMDGAIIIREGGIAGNDEKVDEYRRYTHVTDVCDMLDGGLSTHRMRRNGQPGGHTSPPPSRPKW